MIKNSEKYPEAWAFFIEHARNIEEFYRSSLDSPSLYGKIQGIIEKFSG